MSDIVVDSSVVAKWILPEADSAKAQHLITQASTDGHRLIVLDLVFAEVANAIWKRQRQHLITPKEATAFLKSLREIPVRVEPAIPLLPPAFVIAMRFDRAVYDALFVSWRRKREHVESPPMSRCSMPLMSISLKSCCSATYSRPFTKGSRFSADP